MDKRKQVSQQADVCVKCGFCLPACPTYQLTQHESDSPRGRISLVQAMVDENFPLNNPVLQSHLQSCLTCRACEQMCPAKVEYGQIIDFAKSVLPVPRFRRFLVFVLSNRGLVRLASRVFYMYQRLRLDRLLGFLGLFKWHMLGRLNAYVPKIRHFSRLKAAYVVLNEKGRVGLFLGCVADEFDRQTALSSIKLLNRLGYSVFLPKGQGCCGAMHEHAGMPEKAKWFQSINERVFGEVDVDVVLYSASGCGEALKKGLGDERVMEVGAFVLKQANSLRFRPLKQKVFLHLPCTQRNVLKAPDLTKSMLDLLPSVVVKELPGNAFCCGAAGLNMFENPKTADQLRDQKLKVLAGEPFDVLVTTNIGCSLHFSAGLQKNTPHVRVLHPVSLLGEALVGRD